MMRFGLVVAFAVLSTSVVAQEVDEAKKLADCQLQGALIGAVQTARLDRVRKGDVTNVIMGANPTWPTGLADAIPTIAEYVYSLKRRDLRQVDLATQTTVQCLENYDQIQELSKTAGQ